MTVTKTLVQETTHAAAGRATRRMVLGPAAAASGGLAAACTAGAGSGGGMTGGTQAPAAQPVTVQVWQLPNSQPDEAAYKNLFETLRREAPHVTVDLQAGGAIDKLQTAMAAGTPPDIGRNNILELGTIFARGLAVPAAQALKGVKGWQPEGFLAGLRASHTYKGEMMTVPMVTSAAPMAINLDLLDRAGLKAPAADWSWETLADYATKLTVRGPDTTQWGCIAPGKADTIATNHFNAILHSFGGSWLDAAREKAAFNSPEGQAALEWMVDMVRRRQVSPWPWPDTWTAGGGLTAESRGFSLGKDGGAAMLPYELEDLQRLEQTLSFRWQTVLPPRKKRLAAHQSGFGWFIPKGAPQMEGARTFLRVAAQPETLARWSLDQSRLPTHEAAAARPEWQARLKEKPVLQTHLEAAKNGSTYPGISGWTDARNALAQAIGRVLSGEAAPKAALDEAARQADTVFAQTRGS